VIKDKNTLCLLYDHIKENLYEQNDRVVNLIITKRHDKMNQTAKGAESYLKTSEILQQKYFNMLISSVNVQKGWNILDLGCGTGNGTIKLSNMVGPKGKVVGVDPIAQRIQLAKKRNCRNNIEYHIGYGQNVVEFGKGRFDLVIAASVLHWNQLEEKQRIFKSVFESLKFGGIFVFNSIHNLSTMNTDTFFDLMEDKSHKSTLHSKFYTSTVAEYLLMASDAGFVESSGTKETVRINFENMDSIIELVASSIHTIGYKELLNELREIVNNDKIDKGFLYDKSGVVYQETDILFVKCCKQ